MHTKVKGNISSPGAGKFSVLDVDSGTQVYFSITTEGLIKF